MTTYGMFGLTLEQVIKADADHTRDPHTYLTREEVQTILKDGTYWRTKLKHEWCGLMYYIDVRHKRKWLRLGRADLYDQVRSGTGWTSDDQFYRNPLKHYRESAVYGGRLVGNDLYVLDSLTDG